MRRNYFWGILLILIGLTYVARQVFNIYFPIGTLIMSFVFIYWGIALITGHSGREHHYSHRRNNYEPEKNNYEQNTIFTANEMKGTSEQDKYNIIFGNSVIDFRSLPMPLDMKAIKIDVIFSRGLIKINPDIPAIIKVDSAFSSARFPNGTQISFGNYTYITRSFKADMPYYNIKLDVVFGSSDIIE